MSFARSLLSSLAQRAQWRITQGILTAREATREEQRHDADLDLVLSWALQQASDSAKDISYPLEFLEFVRSCLKKTGCQVTVAKASSTDDQDIPARRFSLLIAQLKSILPLDFLVARDLALLADAFYRNPAPFEAGLSWIGDMGLHFRLSSSLGPNGRILATIVRFMQSEQCLELGTAHGMSAAFILEALRLLGRNGHLATIEGSEALYAISSRALEARYGSQVSCHLGWTQDVLEEVVRSLTDIDFMFHDAGHSKEDYLRDFATVLPHLKQGAVVLIDDIRWNDPKIARQDPRCYEGWMELVNHPRVRQAVEIRIINSQGLLLLD
jgi:predicted O-methyltransferase YrrM